MMKFKPNPYIIYAIHVLMVFLQSYPSSSFAEAHFESNFPSNVQRTEPIRTSAVRNVDGTILLGTTTYGTTGRWIGRAIPVFKKPASKIISTSVVVLDEANRPSAYNPYGVGHQAPQRPTHQVIPNFLPSTNIYFPYGTQPQIPSYNPYFQRPAIPNFFPPHGHFISKTIPKRNLVYNEVDPSYLIYGQNRRGRAYLLERDDKQINITASAVNQSKQNTRKKRKFGNFQLSSSPKFDENADIELLDLNQLTKTTPLPSTQFFSVRPKNMFSTEQKQDQKVLSKFVPITFVPTTPTPKKNMFSFTFRPDDFFSPSETPTPSGFVPFNFIPSTNNTTNTFDIFPITSPNTTNAPSSEDEIDINDIDRVISDIIRIVPARRNNNSPRNELTRRPRIPFPPRTTTQRTITTSRPSRENQKPNSIDTAEVDDEGWTIIRPRFHGTVRRTFLTPRGTPRGTLHPDVEIITDFSGNRKPITPVIDKSLGGTPTRKTTRSDTHADDTSLTPTAEPTEVILNTRTTVRLNEKSSQGDGFDSPTDPLPEHSNDILESIGNDSPITASLSVMTVTSAMTTGVIVTQWLFQ